MKSLLVRFALLLSVVLISASMGVSPASGVGGVGAGSADAAFGDSVERAVVKHTNRQRGKRDVRAVEGQRCVDGFAEDWATHLARTNTFVHRGDLSKVLSKCKTRFVSENIALYPVVEGMSANQVAAKTTGLWMKSEGHRANLLSSKVRLLGVGVALRADGKYWVLVQNFTA